jgi:benzoyl-CoA reductase/2-hydroxyglutaryl-CoA dehydratase subunit BcrC/BadD/HgdB
LKYCLRCQTMLSELFKLFGFESEEIERERNRIEKVFEILEIGSNDMDQAIERINKFFDIESVGMRKVLGLWMKELIDLVLAKKDGKRIAYVSYPPVAEIAAALALNPTEIFCSCPDVVLSNTLNLIFNKINPVLETAEKNGLSPGIAFCSYLQTRLGAIIKGVIPKPDVLIASCYLCDLTPAADQILHEMYGIPVLYIDNVFDIKGEDWPQIEERKITYLASEMYEAVRNLEQALGCEISETKIREAINIRENLNSILGEIRKLAQANPVPLKYNNYRVTYELVGSCIGTGLQKGEEVLKILFEELQKKVNNGAGVLKKDAPKVIVTMISYDPKLTDTIESLGLAIVGSATLTLPGGNPAPSTSLWRQLAEDLMKRRGASYSSWAYIVHLKELARQLGVDGLIFWYHYSCRQYSILSLKAKEVIENELGIPVLLLEGDYCDFRSRTIDQMITKLETFAEMVRLRRELLRRD